MLHFEKIRNECNHLWDATRAAPLWRKAVASMVALWGLGGVVAYGVAGATPETSPLWSMLWFGSVTAFLWISAGWLSVRWMARRMRPGA